MISVNGFNLVSLDPSVPYIYLPHDMWIAATKIIKTTVQLLLKNVNIEESKFSCENGKNKNNQGYCSFAMTCE